MAFSNTVLERKMFPNGLMMERGSWSGSVGAVATGDISLATSGGGADADPDLQDIVMFNFTNTMDHETFVTVATPKKLTLTFTASDTGYYTLFGRCA